MTPDPRHASSSSEKSFLKPQGIVLLIVLLLTVIGLAIYSPTLNAPFLFDDYHNIIENVKLKNLDNLVPIWTHYKSRFIAYLSFAVNYHFNQDRVLGYHLTNITIHVVNAVLVFFIALQLMRSLGKEKEEKVIYSVCLFAALIFLTHPVQTQAISYVVQRIASLATLFYLLTIYLFLEFRRCGRKVFLFMAVAANILAALTKEIAFTLPLAIMLVDMVRSPESPRKIAREHFKTWMFFLIPTLLIPFLVFFGSVQQGQITSTFAETTLYSRGTYFLTQTSVICTYLRLLFFPFNLNLDYDYPFYTTPWDGYWMGCAAALMALLGAAFYLYSRARIVSFCIFWFFLTLSVESSVIPIRDLIQEHRLYLPMFGFALLIPWLLYACLKNTKHFIKVFLMITAIVTAGYGFLSFERNKIWASDIAMWQDVIKKSPLKSRAYHNLAVIYQDQGQDALAEEYYKKALEVGDDNPKTNLNLAVLKISQKEYDQAIRYLEPLLAEKAVRAAALNNLGSCYKDLGENEKAKAYFYEAIKEDNNLIEARENLLVLFKKEGALKEALAMGEEILALDSRNLNARRQLIELYFMAQEKEKAVALGKVLLKEVDQPNSLNALGILFAENAYTNMGLAFFSRSLTIDDNLPDTYLEMGKVLGNADKFNEAVTIWRAGQKKFPQDERFSVFIEQAVNIQNATGEPVKE